ncbi:type II and III secretion system protein family protein [Sphingomonas ginkgonis]|uniref:type II and III secretion system protein family protein n=1 Tax=Sphingomonas ginkgonis TaxID=2315330 RepID=UPI001EF0F8A2|nr:type II and III secretion system protein family protein [Sphingomonas ginkgonis]
MTSNKFNRRSRLSSALVALALGAGAVTAAAPARAAQPVGTYKPTSQVFLSIGEGQMINLPASVSSVWTSNPAVADVYVNSPRSLNLYGKGDGEATVIATALNGSVVYASRVRVSQNISSVNDMLRTAMPDSNITVTPVGQLAVLSGTVASPEDSAQADQLVRAMLNPGVDVSSPTANLKVMTVNRLRTATPLQVNLKVRFAEVNRSVLKSIGINLLSSDSTGGFLFGVGQGSTGAATAPGGSPFKVTPIPGGTTLGIAGKLFGLNLTAALDLAQNDGLATTLAEPNLTALSGETASFLAGGEFPIPVSQAQGAISIEYKQYGVGLAFTPVVLNDGRISMRVRPEVSQLSSAGALTLNGFSVPALTTRRAETTVELGSGQSFMIAGLLQNTAGNSIKKAPLLGDLPILGTLFRSSNFQRNETELVIVITPYLVKPVSGRLPLPTDGYRAPSDAQTVFEGKTYTGRSGPAPVGTLPGPALTTGSAVTGATAAPGFKL